MPQRGNGEGCACEWQWVVCVAGRLSKFERSHCQVRTWCHTALLVPADSLFFMRGDPFKDNQNPNRRRPVGVGLGALGEGGRGLRAGADRAMTCFTEHGHSWRWGAGASCRVKKHKSKGTQSHSLQFKKAPCTLRCQFLRPTSPSVPTKNGWLGPALFPTHHPPSKGSTRMRT
jgi:hypothetical protein